MPGLESRPWHDPASFPFTRLLCAQHATIKAEYLAACAAPGACDPSARPDPYQNPSPNLNPNPNPNPLTLTPTLTLTLTLTPTPPNPNPNPNPSPIPVPHPNPNP